MKDTRAGKEEADQFDSWLKEKCKDIYDGVATQGKYRTVMLLKLLRKTKFRGCNFIVTILHALGCGI